VNFWATWCPPCREEIPDLQKLYDNKDIEILAIDLTETEQSMGDVEEFVFDEFEMTFPVLLDEESKIAEMYQVMAYPTSYLVDRKSTRLNSSHVSISYAVFCLKKQTSMIDTI